MKKIVMVPGVLIFFALTVFIHPMETQAEMSGTLYRSKSSVLSGGGSPMQSVSFKSNSSMGQAGSIGFASSANYVVSAGFWPEAFLELLLLAGDVNGDRVVDLKDAITALKIISGIDGGRIILRADVNNDQKIGVQEAIFVLRDVSELP